MDRGAWWAIVYGVTKSQKRLRDFHSITHNRGRWMKSLEFESYKLNRCGKNTEVFIEISERLSLMNRGWITGLIIHHKTKGKSEEKKKTNKYKQCKISIWWTNNLFAKIKWTLQRKIAEARVYSVPFKMSNVPSKLLKNVKKQLF